MLSLFSFKDGSTALFKAAFKGHNTVIEELLKFSPALGLLKVWDGATYFDIWGNMFTHFLVEGDIGRQSVQWRRKSLPHDLEMLFYTKNLNLSYIY